MASIMTGTSRQAKCVVALTLVVASAAILSGAPSAFGQAALDQYIPSADPAGHAGGGGDSGSGSPTSGEAALGARGGGVQAVAPDPGAGSASGRNLPLTDYPVTPFVGIALAVVAIGILIRVVAPVLARRFPEAG
jgi:hypothetical protein